jgi:hypothetical protein
MFNSRYLNELYFYSCGRHAIREIFRLIHLKSGNRVLLPRFICRDILDCITEFDAQVTYYDVSRQNLIPEITVRNCLSAEVIFVVNYFGFPQDISKVDICRNTSSAILVEDNAHGYLSKDEVGNYLGVRSDFGIFSPRKTLTIPNGGLLYIRHEDRVGFASRYEPASASLSHNQSLKKLLRRANGLGTRLLGGILRFKYLLRFWRSRANGSSKSSSHLKIPANPWSGLRMTLEGLDERIESERRRTLYLHFEKELVRMRYEKVFTNLPLHCVPYGFPFYSADGKIGPAVVAASKYGLGVMKWPDLPEAAGIPHSHFYRNIYLINFQI